jgi:hypothetical protein
MRCGGLLLYSCTRMLLLLLLCLCLLVGALLLLRTSSVHSILNGVTADPPTLSPTQGP